MGKKGKKSKGNIDLSDNEEPPQDNAKEVRKIWDIRWDLSEKAEPLISNFSTYKKLSLPLAYFAFHILFLSFYLHSMS